MSDSTKTIVIGAAIFIVACLVVAILAVLLLAPLIPVANVPPVATTQPTSPALPPSVGPTTSVKPASTWYQVYFTNPKYPDKESDHHGGLDEPLTAFLNSAKSSIDMAIYQFDLPNATQALLDAKQRGVTVRVVTDIDILDDPQENPSFKQLQKVGILVIGGNSNGIMHDKFVVVDKAAVWTGSWNFTTNDTYRYNNNGILIQSPELAKNYTATFEKMFVDKKFAAQRKPGGTTPHLSIAGVNVENYFAPEDKVASKIVPRLKQAAQTIDFLAYSFTDDDMGAAVIDRSKAGVKVRGVFEKTGSETQFSEYGKMVQAKLDVYQDGNPYLMHHKVFIVDGKTVIFGSFNFSASADTDNDENLLIIDDAGLAQSFENEFVRVYDAAKSAAKK